MDSNSYQLYNEHQQHHSSAQRYRPTPPQSPYPIHQDPIYHLPAFHDPVSPYTTPTSPYDIMSISNSKLDQPIHHYSPALSGKDFSPQSFPADFHDRRLHSVSSNGYPSDYPDDYAMTSIPQNPSIPFSPPLQQFPDRLARFPPERYTQHNVPNLLPQMHPNHSTDIIRSAVQQPPTPSFRDNNIPSYNEIQYLGNSEMRIHAVDETLSRMKLQGNPVVGPSSDLQSFIRYVLPFQSNPSNLLIFFLL